MGKSRSRPAVGETSFQNKAEAHSGKSDDGQLADMQGDGPVDTRGLGHTDTSTRLCITKTGRGRWRPEVGAQDRNGLCLEGVGSQRGNPERGSPQPCRGVDAGRPLFQNLLNRKCTRGALERCGSNCRSHEVRMEPGAVKPRGPPSGKRGEGKATAGHSAPGAPLSLACPGQSGSGALQHFFTGGSRGGSCVHMSLLGCG